MVALASSRLRFEDGINRRQDHFISSLFTGLLGNFYTSGDLNVHFSLTHAYLLVLFVSRDDANYSESNSAHRKQLVFVNEHKVTTQSFFMQ